MAHSKYHKSAAVTVLRSAGVTLADVADTLGLSVSAVSMQLSGKRRQHPGLVPVLRCLLGADTAAHVERLLEPQGSR